jgi:1-acyl-sn-glycerol-3-phosphate acyltransferase
VAGADGTRSGYSANMTERAAPIVDRNDVDRATATVLATVETVLRELHAGRSALPTVGLDSSLDHELALDSLSRVELGARLERAFDVGLNETTMFDAATPRDLLRAIAKASGGRPLTLRTVTAEHTIVSGTGKPESATTLVEMLEWHVRRHGDRAHIQFFDDYSDGEILTYADLHSGAVTVASGLQDHGLMPGESVALMLPTGPAYFFCFYAVLLAGGIPVPIYPPVRRQQLEDHLRRQSRILANCRAVMLITTADALAVARLLTVAVESLRHVLDAEVLLDAEGDFEAVMRRPEDTAFLQYTSGSTGDPKGVILSHANLLANVRADGHAMAAGEADVFVSWLPLYHDMGLIGAWLGSLYHAVRLVVMPPLTFLARPERWLWAIHRYGGTLSAAPNFAYELCLKRISDSAIEGLDLSAWRVAANGAEAISATTLEAFCQRFASYGFNARAMLPVYGLAECSVGLAFSPLGRGALVDVIDRSALAQRGIATPATDNSAEKDKLAIVACGQPLPLHEVRIVDPAGRELPEREEGHLQFRGPSATVGYFERPAATSELIDDGWLNSGDRAYLAGGDIFMTGRSKDIIIRAGRNIYPPELEDAIGDIDGIRKGYVAIFGIADDAIGSERLVVLAETRQLKDNRLESLRVAINRLAGDLVGAPPDEIVFAPPNTVLRTSSGKIRRAACRELYEQGRIGQHEHALWLQTARLAAAGVGPQLRRLLRATRAWAFASWAWSVFIALALLAWALAWLPLSRQRLWQSERWVARAAGTFTATPIAVHGLERLPPSGTPCIIVANHQSYLDGILALAALPYALHFLIKGELRQSRLLAYPLERIGGLFVERFNAASGIAGLHKAAAVLADGGVLVIFPEGTFKRMPGLLPFHMGAFTTAAEAKVPIIPLAIRGTRSVLRAGSWFPRRGAIEIDIGQALEVPENAERWDRALQLRDATREYILEHCGEPDLAHESNVVD